MLRNKEPAMSPRRSKSNADTVRLITAILRLLAAGLDWLDDHGWLGW
jgi:hypothetical protein